MPTVLVIDGLRVVVYPNDHRPAHVHVIGRGCEAVFCLQCPDGPPSVRENMGFSRRELEKIDRALVLALPELCAQWRRLHGDF